MRLLRSLIRAQERIRWRRLQKSLDTLDQVQERHPEFLDWRAEIRRSGTDNLEDFGNAYEHEGGMFLQQNPDEFAALCLFLKQHGRLKHYLEIGTASGGTARFLWNRFQFVQVLCLDDGNHPRADVQEQHLTAIRGCHRYRGDSHDVAAQRFLEKHVREPIDVAFVDGDHSYDGVWQDIRMVLPFCQTGSLLILHDTVACASVQQAWRELLYQRLAIPRAEYIGYEKPLGIGIAAVA